MEAIMPLAQTMYTTDIFFIKIKNDLVRVLFDTAKLLIFDATEYFK